MTSVSTVGDIHARLAPGEDLLHVEDLSVEFPIKSTILRRNLGSIEAVAGISFDLHAGETLGLVGESGCGKSTTGLAVLRLIEHSAGSIIFRGHDLSKLNSSEMRPFRREMQIVLQDPQSSLDPRLTVRSIIAEPIRVHGLAEGQALGKRVDELLELVGLRPAHGTRFPHEFSGGQRQRIGIARALALGPQLLGHTSFNWALRRLSATVVAVSILGEPIGSALLAWWLLDERFVPLQLAGFVVLLAGIFVAARAELADQSGTRVQRDRS